MTKEEYINFSEKNFQGKAQKLMLDQIENFYELDTKKIKKPKYNIGDEVKLKKNTFLHGFGNNLDILKLCSQQGLINTDFETGVTNHKICYCVSLWHIKKDTKLKDYIVQYSGMTVKNGKEHILVPYKKFDEFIEKVRKMNYWSLEVESTMETRFMPSLSKDSDKLQLAFIINGYDKVCKKLVWHNLLNEEIDVDTVFNFMHFKKPEFNDMFRESRQYYDDARIAYLMFGLPKSTFEGVLVGRKYEKSKKILKKIKEMLPECYICNLDGKVIM